MISAVCKLSLFVCASGHACVCVLLRPRAHPCTLHKQACINAHCLLSVVQALQHQLALPGAICPATSLPHTCSPPHPPTSPPPQHSGYRVKCIRPLLTDTDVALQKGWQPFYSHLHTYTKAQKHTHKQFRYVFLVGRRWVRVRLKKVVCVCRLHTDTMWHANAHPVTLALLFAFFSSGAF